MPNRLIDSRLSACRLILLFIIHYFSIILFTIQRMLIYCIMRLTGSCAPVLQKYFIRILKHVNLIGKLIYFFPIIVIYHYIYIFFFRIFIMHAIKKYLSFKFNSSNNVLGHFNRHSSHFVYHPEQISNELGMRLITIKQFNDLVMIKRLFFLILILFQENLPRRICIKPLIMLWIQY